MGDLCLTVPIEDGDKRGICVPVLISFIDREREVLKGPVEGYGLYLSLFL